MKIGAVLVIIWLLIGTLAAWQRDYFSNDKTDCAETSTIIVTIVSGPLNYVGLNPKTKCKLPEPSR